MLGGGARRGGVVGTEGVDNRLWQTSGLGAMAAMVVPVKAAGAAQHWWRAGSVRAALMVGMVTDAK